MVCTLGVWDMDTELTLADQFLRSPFSFCCWKPGIEAPLAIPAMTWLLLIGCPEVTVEFLMAPAA